MKRLLFLLLIVFASHSIALSQDVILKNDETEIKAKVLEITPDGIKYKDFEFQDGPTRTIKISEVSMIIYENGRTEKFQAIDPKAEKSTEKAKYKPNYFMLGIGGGNSYGGLGINIQFRLGGLAGFGLHFGLGYTPGIFKYSEELPTDIYGNYIMPESYIRPTAGIKFYPYKNLYLNFQTALHGNRHFTGSALIGVDANWGVKIGSGFSLALGITFLDNLYGNGSIRPAADMGFIIRF